MADHGWTYFPLQTGLYHIYRVNEIRYTGIAEPEALLYDIMTEVVDSFPSTAGGYHYVIHRSRRDGAGDSWEPLDTWSVRRSDREVIVSEGNTPFVKMTFPVVTGAVWDGNALNNLGVDDYTLLQEGQPIDLEGMTFEKTVTVEQERNTDVIVFRDERREVYARDVGLVYREIIQLQYCTEDVCLGQQKIENGVEMKVAIKEYGKH